MGYRSVLYRPEEWVDVETVHLTTREGIGSAQTTSFAALFARISGRSSSRFDTWRPPGD